MHLYLQDEIGTGATGSVAKALMTGDGFEQDIVVKLMEKNLSLFHAEAASYNIVNVPICPKFYGAFIGDSPGRHKFGAIVLERLWYTFYDEHEMSEEQR